MLEDSAQTAHRRGQPVRPPGRLQLFAKQAAVAMQFLAAIGIEPSFVHAGNVLLSAADGSTGAAESVAFSDIENGFLFSDKHAPPPADGAIDAAAVASYGRLLYEMATGHLLERPPVGTLPFCDLSLSFTVFP